MPANAKVHYNYANVLKEDGNFQLAVRHYRQALRYLPQHKCIEKCIHAVFSQIVASIRIGSQQLGNSVRGSSRGSSSFDDGFEYRSVASQLPLQHGRPLQVTLAKVAGKTQQY